MSKHEAAEQGVDDWSRLQRESPTVCICTQGDSSAASAPNETSTETSAGCTERADQDRPTWTACTRARMSRPSAPAVRRASKQTALMVPWPMRAPDWSTVSEASTSTGCTQHGWLRPLVQVCRPQQCMRSLTACRQALGLATGCTQGWLRLPGGRNKTNRSEKDVTGCSFAPHH